MKNTSLGILVALMAMSSCSTTYNKNQKSSSLHVSAKSDLRADLDIDMTKKISGSATHTKLFGIFDLKTSQSYVDGVNYDVPASGFFSGGVVEETKAAAAYNAVAPNKVDVIVAPQYVIKVKTVFLGAYKEVTAQVTGYGAKIRNIVQTQK
jgi:hypothetical protein